MICGKRIFSTRSEANKSIDGFHKDNRPQKGNSKPIYSYFCKECNGWHMASKKKHKVGFVQNDSNVTSQAQDNKKREIKAGTKNLIIHERLNFKVK